MTNKPYAEVASMTIEYHEPPSELSAETRDIHRALTTLVEELEAVDWYHGRAELATDPELKAMIIHHRDEEIEHAAMAIEWLRRRMPEFDKELRTFLFTSAPLLEVEEAEEGDGDASDAAAKPKSGDLGIGSLKS